MDPSTTTPAGGEIPPTEQSPRQTRDLYHTLMDTLDQRDREAVVQAIKRHDDEVSAAEAAGLRAVEAR